MERTQRIVVADAHTIHDDGKEVRVPSLDTTDWIEDREVLADKVSREVDLDKLAEHVNEEIGGVHVDETGAVESIKLDDWVVEQYGF